MPELEEVLVVDGGSTDRTVERALRHGVRVIEGRRGRGPQLNAGAAAARGEVLLFQHADVSLPGDAPGWIRLAFQDPEVVAGAFRVRTIDEDGSRLAPLLPFANLRSRTRSLPYGDQALFVRRSVFEAVGGYPDQPLMEDIELAAGVIGFDSDGEDLLVWSFDEVVLLEADGVGGFGACPLLEGAPDAVADLDGNGKPDLVSVLEGWEIAFTE